MAITNKIMKTFNVPNGSNTTCYEIVDDKGRKCIAKDWYANSTAKFNAGEYVIKDGVCYRFTTTHAANTSWSSSEVAATNLGAELSDVKSALSEVTEQTRNLITGKIAGASIDSTPKIISNMSSYAIYYTPVTSGKTYYVSTDDASGLVCAFFNDVPAVGSVATGSRIIQASKTITAPMTGYIAFRTNAGYANAQIEEGTSKTAYIRPVSAVDAVAREQITKTNEDINDLTEYVEKVEDGSILNSKVLVPITELLTGATYTDNDIIKVTNGAVAHASLTGFVSAKWDISAFVGKYIMIYGISYAVALSWIIAQSDDTVLLNAENPASGTLKNLDTVQIPENAKYLYYCSPSDNAHIGFKAFPPMIVNGYMDNKSGTGSELVLADPSFVIDGKFLMTRGVGNIPDYATFDGYAIACIRVLKCHTYHIHSARIYKQSSYVLTDNYFETKVTDYTNTQESVTTLVEYTGDIVPEQDGWLLYQTKVDSKVGYSCKVTGSTKFTANILEGKKLVTAGDSYTAASFDGDYAQYNGKNFGYYIAKRNNMSFVNAGISGSTMAVSNPSSPTTKSPFSYQRYLNVPADTDYLVIWFGINDTAYCELGEITDEENTTFYGAWNKVLKYYLTNYPFMRILIVVTPVAGSTYQQAVREVAKKWGYPYMDWVKDETIPAFFERDGMGSEALALRRDAFGWNGPVSGHPNPAWHEYESTIIEAKLRSV